MVDPREDLGDWLSEEEAHRLLARAVELDAQHRAAVSIADLERAAVEAGVEPKAFLQALAELRSGALEPLTIGQRFASRLVRYRGPAALAAFVSAAGITPGDAVTVTAFLGFGLYGAFEGLAALAHFFGKTPPRIPPEAPPTQDRSTEGGRERPDPPGVRFVLARQHVSAVPTPLG